jgi:hypothetical protein
LKKFHLAALLKIVFLFQRKLIPGWKGNPGFYVFYSYSHYSSVEPQLATGVNRGKELLFAPPFF